jgi:hypothetical protein
MLVYNLHSPPASGKQGLIYEEMYQTLSTNKKQDYIQAANIIRQTQTRIDCEKYTFCVIKSLEFLKIKELAASPI